jgi:hypothetical protein
LTAGHERLKGVKRAHGFEERPRSVLEENSIRLMPFTLFMPFSQFFSGKDLLQLAG